MGLFFVGLQLGQNGSAFIVSIPAAILATLTALSALIVYIAHPKEHMRELSTGIYLLFAASMALVVVQSGGLSSPFLALWLFVAIFSGLFNWIGLLTVFAASHGYLFYAAVTHHNGLTRDALVLFALSAELPLIVSYIVWHRNMGQKQHTEDKAFDALAQELNQVANKSDIVINAIGDGVIALDPRGTIQLINPAAQDILGWTKQDAMGLDYRSVIKLTDKANKAVTEATDPIQQVLRTGTSKVDNNLTLTTRAGKQILLSLLVSPLGNTPGSGAITIFRDITAEKAEERQQAEFISTASHEMRTPVASMEGYLGLALNPATATIDDKARMYLTKAHEAAQHMGRLFQDLLDVSKAEDGRLTNNPTVVDVVQFMRDIVIGLAPKAQAKGLILYYKPGEVSGSGRQVTPVFYTKVDNDHLREITSNLVDNAIKYTPKGSVTVDVKGDDTHVQIIVKDTGIGIPREDQSHLFQKFYRVDNSDTREIGGTGLGLYLSRRLAEAIGGSIRLESEYQRGSTFTLELPRMSHEDALDEIERQTEAKTAESPEIILGHEQPLADVAPPTQQPATATPTQASATIQPPAIQPQAPITSAPAAPTVSAYTQTPLEAARAAMAAPTSGAAAIPRPTVDPMLRAASPIQAPARRTVASPSTHMSAPPPL